MSELVLSQALVLHRYAYSESSLLLKILAPEMPLLTLLAKGVKSPRRTKSFKGNLASFCEPFNLLRLGYSGRGEVKTLRDCELIGSVGERLTREYLICGLYLNEILLALLGPAACSLELFQAYLLAIKKLTQAQYQLDPMGQVGPALRIFEKKLLEETGHGLELIQDQAGDLIQPEACYEIYPGTAPRKVENKLTQQHSAYFYPGKVLWALQAGSYELLQDPVLALEAKRLLRQWIGFYTDGKVLKTKRMMREIKEIMGVMSE